MRPCREHAVVLEGERQLGGRAVERAIRAASSDAQYDATKPRIRSISSSVAAG
jgi:hypothetical protein